MDLDGLIAKAEAATKGWPTASHIGDVDARNAFREAITPEVAKALIRVAKAAKPVMDRLLADYPRAAQFDGELLALSKALADLEALP